ELTVGTTDYTITATVGSLTTTKSVQLEVTAVVLESIAFKGDLNLRSCYAGEPLELAGLSVEAAYSNGTTKDVTAEVSITTSEFTKSDTVTITASYEGQIATQKAYIYVCKRPSTIGTVLLSYEHKGTAPTGIELGDDLSIGSAKIDSNTVSVNGINLDGGYIKNNAYVPGKVVSLSIEGGFKPLDEIVVAAFFNNSSNTKQAQVTIFTLNADSTTTTLHTIGQAVNGHLVHNDPFEAVYTLETAADTIRLGRLGNTSTYIYTIKVIRPEKGPSTAVDQASVETKVQKLIRNGQLLIIREGKTYTAQGVQVQ
ncbi:MAG: bacterial Ig-like domain-containing protein, partial [Paludibacteraceae bacterium]